MTLREDFIHFHIRKALKSEGWQLVAGQYPNGSDDELPPLCILDLELARDRSPDHRRHSFHKLVPDLVAVKERSLLVVEAKPTFDLNDETKLIHIRDDRRTEFDVALAPILRRAGLTAGPMIYTFIPCLAMSDGSPVIRRNDFDYLFVNAQGGVSMEMRN